MKKVICSILLVLSISSEASQQTFSNVQLDNLKFAYEFGEQFGKDGKFKDHKTRYDDNGLGYIMAAMTWQETSAGLNMPFKKGHEAHGMFQNYLPTLRARTRQIGWNMTDQELVGMVSSRNNSASWAYIELSYWLNVHKGDIKKSIASYNAGNSWHKGSKYANDVLAKANYLKSHQMLKAMVE